MSSSSLPPASLACTICSEYYKPTDEVLATSCGHVFHQACFQDWQTRSLTCPDCRSALPQTNRLYLHFEEHTQEERQLHESKLELISKVASLQRQLSESEANFINALEALSGKEEQVMALINEIEYRKAQNDSYEVALNQLKSKLNANNFEKNLHDALDGLKISVAAGIEKFAQEQADVDVVDMDAASSSSTDNTISESNPTAEPIKNIFATKFAPDTTELEIKLYIQEKLPNLKELTVFKFPAPPFRRICSFRITLPQSYYDTVVHSSFWPEFTHVREFVDRPRCVTLPELETTEVVL